MAPTEEPEVRLYTVLLSQGERAEFRAQTLCRPDDGNSKYRFKANGEIVGEIEGAHVIGWFCKLVPQKGG